MTICWNLSEDILQLDQTTHRYNYKSNTGSKISTRCC